MHETLIQATIVSDYVARASQKRSFRQEGSAAPGVHSGDAGGLAASHLGVAPVFIPASRCRHPLAIGASPTFGFEGLLL